MIREKGMFLLFIEPDEIKISFSFAVSGTFIWDVDGIRKFISQSCRLCNGMKERLEINEL